MADVDIVIGAKDQASAILKDVGHNTQKLGKDVQAVAKDVDTASISFKSLAIAGTAITAAFGAIRGIGVIGGFLSHSIEEFDQAAEAIRKLTTAINLSGEDASKSIEGHSALAEAMERTLNIEAEVTEGLMANAAMMGVSEKQIDSVTLAAIGLAETMGIDVDKALTSVRKAQEGSFTMFEKLIPAMRTMGTEEEKLAYITALAEKGLIQKAGAADGSAQAATRAHLAMKQLQESVGEMIGPLKDVVFEGFAAFTYAINESLGPAIRESRELFTNFKDTVVAGARWLAEQVVGAVTLVEVVWNNLGNVFGIIASSIALSLETMRADIMHVMTVALPAYASWFAENWLNLLTDAFNATLTVVQNYTTNMSEIMLRLWDFITSGMKGGIAGLTNDVMAIASKSLLDGFQAVTSALPDIAARGMTDMETILSQNITDSTTSIMEEFQTKFNERIGNINKDMQSDPIKAKIELEVNRDPKGKERDKKIKVDNAVLASSETRLLTRGSGPDPIELAKQTNEAMQQMASNFAPVAASLAGLVPGLVAIQGTLESINKNTDVESEEL